MPAVRIRTDRLWLRPFAAADVDPLHVLFGLPDVRRFLLDDAVMPRSWVEEVVLRSDADFTTSAGLWIVALEEAGPPVGFTGYREFHEPPVRELLYGLDPDHQGRGLALEAARAAARYGFEALGLDPIRASVDVPDEPSIRLARRLGFRETRRAPGPAHEQVFFALGRAGFDAGAGRFEVRPSGGSRPAESEPGGPG